MSDTLDLKNKFIKRFNKLFTEEKISKRKLSKLSGVNMRSVTEYLEGLFFPRYDTLVKLANYFEVSTDYILGISDNDNYKDKFDQIDNIPKIFRNNLKELLQEKGMTEYKFSKALGVGQGKITTWLRYCAMPEVPMLVKIAHTLECSVDYLLGRS